MPDLEPAEPAEPAAPPSVPLPSVEMFENRLRKNLRRLRPWAAREGVVAYRVYDRDIPEIGLNVDYYDGQVHAAEYARRAPTSEAAHAAWLDEVQTAISDALEVPRRDVFLKRRERQRGAAQYERLGASGAERPIKEGGHRFLVNLTDYLDTGLFLDHRETRRRVGERSRGQEVLNLFGYTGSFSVYAAGGGAIRTVTVDLSNTYLSWAGRNLALNGFSSQRNELVRADARGYLAEAARDPRQRGRYGIIVLDPPTFSNSKRMDGVLDIARDHPMLLRDALQLLRRDGMLFFSSNFRGLQLAADQVPGARFLEITDQTIPHDFHDRRVHRCWQVEHA